jgi:GntR family transcriptional regulator
LGAFNVLLLITIRRSNNFHIKPLTYRYNGITIIHKSTIFSVLPLVIIAGGDTVRRKLIKESLSDKVREHLKTMIANKEFGPTGQLPREDVLGEQLGVSRITVRDALANLEMDGYIYRKQGKGTFANYRVARIKHRISSAKEFFALINEKGFMPSVPYCRHYTQQAGPLVGDKLGCSPGTDIVTIEKLFLADELPVIYCINMIPAHLVEPGLFQEDLTRPIFKLLRKFSFPPIQYDIVDIIPTVADEKIAELMSLEQGSPLLLLEATAYDIDEKPIILFQEYYREGFIRFSEVRTTHYHR